MKHRRGQVVIAAVLGLIASVAGLAGSAQAAGAQSTTEARRVADTRTQTGVGTTAARPPGYYLLVNAINGRCADVSGKSNLAGALVHQWGCVNENNQLWSPVDLGNGYFLLKNLNSANMCMNVKNDSGVSGNLIEQRPCDARQSEWWRWQAADSFGHLVLNSGLGNWCMALSPYSVRNGTSIVIHQCATTSGQMWRFG